MVSERSQNKSPQKGSHNEDVYLNDLQVEIKQEEELIIEDADQQNVTWCFIGIDDDAEEGDVDYEEFHQQMYFQNQYNNGILPHSFNNSSFEEIIEISDDDDDYEHSDKIIGNDTSNDAVIDNGPLESRFSGINGLNDQDTPSGDTYEETMGSDENTVSTQECNDDGAPNEEAYMNSTKQLVKSKESDGEHSGINVNENMDCLNVGMVNDWMYRKLMKMVCHICGSSFQHKVYTWLYHMKQLHPKFLHEVVTKYVMRSDNVGNCKQCKMDVAPKINHSFHYLTRHLETHIFICSFCSYTDSSIMTLQKHQLEKHPIVINQREECPKCFDSFKDVTTLEYHFMSVHSREFNSRYVYKCHLCKGIPAESSKNKFYAHLIDQHKLGNWKSLNFRKIDNGQHMICSKCHKIFMKMNVHQLLGHYLTHEEKSCWSCKFCKSLHHFTDWPTAHLCTAMRDYYIAKSKSNEFDKETYGEENKDTLQQQQDPLSWEEFEGYIQHVCPFCNEVFDKFEEWRLHVRELHRIHTLEGLNMTIIPEESEKLLCLQCYSSVTKSAIELHKHRFQHLPYRPYKCRHCSKSIGTHKMAISHVQNHCQDGPDVEATSTNATIYKNESLTTEAATRLISISCTLCNNRRFATFSQMAKHINAVHDNFRKYFTKPTKESGRVCKICQNEVKRNKNRELICHYLQHLHERPYKCIKCTRSYPTYRVALGHAKAYHVDTTITDAGDVKMSDIKQESEKNSSSRSVEENSKIFEAEKKTAGMNDIVLVDKTETISGINSSPSGENNVEIVAQENISPHGAKDNAKVLKMFEQFIKYACPECNESLPSRHSWEFHIRSKHTFFEENNLHIEKYYRKGRCTDCSSVIHTGLSKYQAHKLTHMPYRSFVCSLCSERYTVASSLYKHLRNVHFLKGSFKCPLCAQVLRTDVERLDHLNQYHPTTEWPTNLCIKCGNIVDNLDNHLLTHHLDHDRNYRCKHCGIYYEHVRELDTHLARSHRDTTSVEDNTSEMSIANQVGKRKLRSLSPGEKCSNAKKSCAVAAIRKKRK